MEFDVFYVGAPGIGQVPYFSFHGLVDFGLDEIHGALAGEVYRMGFDLFPYFLDDFRELWIGFRQFFQGFLDEDLVLMGVGGHESARFGDVLLDEGHDVLIVDDGTAGGFEFVFDVDIGDIGIDATTGIVLSFPKLCDDVLVPALIVF